jgi:uncharacterized phage-associated protein
MPSVHDVAAYIVSRQKCVTAMKLQKLVYYCQAWSLVWDERALFPEPIEAWANGPVVPELYYAHQGEFEIRSIRDAHPEHIDKDGLDTIDAVLSAYGACSAQRLSDLTHAERPWRDARAGLADGERGNRVISLASMEEYYSSLNANGQEES